MNERDIIILENYAATHLAEPNLEWANDAFDVCVYSRWAVNEILERMMDETTKLPEFISGIPRKSTVQIITEYIYEMEGAYREVNNVEQKMIFFIAASTARSILSLFQKNNRKEKGNGYF